MKHVIMVLLKLLPKYLLGVVKAVHYSKARNSFITTTFTPEDGRLGGNM
jgi:hypothetical protein